MTILFEYLAYLRISGTLLTFTQSSFKVVITLIEPPTIAIRRSDEYNNGIISAEY